MNLEKSFKDYKGEDIVVKKEIPTKDGKKEYVEEKQLIKDTVCKCLYSCGEGFTADEKYSAYKLNLRLIPSSKELELTLEEASLIKKTAEKSLTAGAYGQIVELIEGGE